MSTATQHYRELLAEHYVWMFGVPFGEKVAEQKALLEQVLPQSMRKGIAFDLGSGPGFQSIALAELGYSPVIAIDTSRELLSELAAYRGSHNIRTTEADISSLPSIGTEESAAVVVCMGDTLTHLPTKAAVQECFCAAFVKLKISGVFVITYRDLTAPLYGLDRFLAVRADDSKILTCFLEYTDDETVLVNDLLHLRGDSGWHLHKSSYRKLRLSQKWLESQLMVAGFQIEQSEPAGRMLIVVARKI